MRVIFDGIRVLRNKNDDKIDLYAVIEQVRHDCPQGINFIIA